MFFDMISIFKFLVLEKTHKSVLLWEKSFVTGGRGETHRSILLWEKSFVTGGGSIQECFSNFSNNQFFKGRNCQENLVSQHKFRPSKSFKLGQIWHQL